MKSLKMSSMKASSLSSLAASAAGAVSLFAIFRIGLDQVSIAAVGCWALLQGVFIISRIADSGAGTNVTRYVAVRRSQNTSVGLWAILAGSLSVATIPVVFIGFVTYWPATLYVTYRYGHVFSAVNIDRLAQAAFLFGALSSTGTIVLAAVEGMGRIVEKNLIMTGGYIAGLLLAFPVISIFGLAGIGYTYSLTAAVQLLGGLLYIFRMTDVGQSPTSVRTIARELWSENMQLSFVALLRLSFEPVTKLLLSTTATLAVVAAFELALRVSTQIRVFMQAIVQPLLIMGARTEVDMAEEAVVRFSHMRNSIASLSGWLMEAQLVGAPVLSWVGLGHLDNSFLAFFAILTIANWLNSLGLVGYYFRLSSGSMRPLVNIQILMAVLNLAAGVFAALIAGSAFLVAGAYGLAFAVGGVASGRLMPGGFTLVSKSWRSKQRIWFILRGFTWVALGIFSSILATHVDWVLPILVSVAGGLLVLLLMIRELIPMRQSRQGA